MINVVCALIVDASGRVLCCRRPSGKMLAGKWEFPGGKVEPGESPEAAISREILEELGCHVRVHSAMRPVEHHYPEFCIRLQAFRCDLIQGEPVAHEHDAIRWMKGDELAGLDWAEADVPIWREWLATVDQ